MFSNTNKRILSFILSIILVLSMVPTYVFAATSGDVRSFMVIHNNDTHARTKGSAITAGLEDYYKANNIEYQVLHAGDAFQGQSIASITNGEAISQIMNAVGYDYMAVGNHEFDFGFTQLLKLQKMSNVKMLSANILYKSTGKPVFQDSDIKVLKNGLKIGYFGITTDETLTKTNPVNVKDLEFADPVETAKKEVAKLKGEGVDVIICLSHLGVDESSKFTSKLVAQKVDGIDLMVDGHSHTVLPNGIKVNNTLIVQTGSYYDYIGLVNVTVDSSGKVTCDAKLLSTDFKKNPLPDEYKNYVPRKSVDDLVAKIKKDNSAITDKIVGKTDVVLDADREDVRVRETNLSSLVADSMLKETTSDIAFIDGGGIRTSIPIGDITMGEVISVLPFGDAIVTKDIPGKDVMAMLENGVSSVPNSAGSFLHVAGIKVTYDSSKPAGSRIVSVSMEDGKPFDINKTYTISTNEFMAAGGDNYKQFANYPVKMQYNTDADILIKYINSGIAIPKVPSKRMIDINKSVGDKLTNVSSDKYVVVKGDCLFRLGVKNSVDWKKIAKDNNINSPYIIYPEQKLVINK